MADFTSNFWAIFIFVTTVISFVALFILIGKCKGGKKISADEDKDTTGHVWDEDLKEYNNPLPGWWLNLFYITLVFGIVYLILYPGLGLYEGYLGWSQVKQYEEEVENAREKYEPIYEQYANQDIADLINNPEALQIGKRLYSAYCTQCHGSDAGGARGYPNLRDDSWLWGGEPEAIKTTILNGRQAAMPAWKGVLTDENIDQVSEYIISLSGRTYDVSTATEGKKIFSQYCAVCHGAEAKGNTMMGAPNLADDYWLYGGSKNRIMESISAGRQGRMPANKEFLGEARIHLLAAYIYSLSKK